MILFDESAQVRRQPDDRRVNQTLPNQLRLVVDKAYDVKARVASFEGGPRELDCLFARAQYQHTLSHAQLRVTGAPCNKQTPRGNERENQRHVNQENASTQLKRGHQVKEYAEQHGRNAERDEKVDNHATISSSRRKIVKIKQVERQLDYCSQHHQLQPTAMLEHRGTAFRAETDICSRQCGEHQDHSFSKYEE